MTESSSSSSRSGSNPNLDALAALCVDSRTLPKKTISKKNVVSQNKTKKRKRNKFQMRAKKFYLTFPQCTKSKEHCSNIICGQFPNYKFIIVAAEMGANNQNPHLHIVISLKDIFYTSDPHYWDFVTGQHGNYQVCKDIYKVIKYITKDNDFIEVGINTKAYLKSRKCKSSYGFELCAISIRAGKTKDQIDDENPGFMMHNQDKIDKYIVYQEKKKYKISQKNKLIWKDLSLFGLPSEHYDLAVWLNHNLNGPEREHKQEQLWLWGPTDIGKSYLIRNLEKYFRIYPVDVLGKGFDDYNDDDFDIVVFDEFKGQKTITTMNSFVEGGRYHVHRRYNNVYKDKNLPVIVLSNYSIEGAYYKTAQEDPSRLDPLKTRFTVIHFENPIFPLINF